MKTSENSKSRSTRVLLATVALLLAGNLLWQMQSFAPRTAHAAGIPDSGAQLEKVIEELKTLNGNVQKLQSYLESGKLVVVTDTKDSKDK